MKHLTTIFFALTVTIASGQVIDSVKSGDIKVYFEVSGIGEPVYILSGGPGITPASMIPIVNELSKKYQCILVHQRGTGKTIIPINEQTIQIENYCQDIKSIKEKLGHKKISLLGHSWGGMLSMDYSVKYPDDINKLILVGSGGYNLNFFSYFGENIKSRLSLDDQKTTQILEEFMSRMDKSLYLDKVESELNYLMTEYVNIILKGYMFDKTKADQVKLTSRDFNSKIAGLMFGSLGKKNWDLKHSLEKLNVKALVIQGRQDPIDKETAQGIHSAIKGSELYIIERSGHFPWIEQPTDFYKKIFEYLGR
jgi:proline iminopeptidase